MRKVEMQTAGTVSNSEATERLVKILGSTYKNAYLEQVDNNTTHMNSQERTQLLTLLKYFKELCYCTLGERNKYPIEFDFNPNYKPFKCKYDMVPIVNKNNFRKYL